MVLQHSQIRSRTKAWNPFKHAHAALFHYCILVKTSHRLCCSYTLIPICKSTSNIAKFAILLLDPIFKNIQAHTNGFLSSVYVLLEIPRASGNCVYLCWHSTLKISFGPRRRTHRVSASRYPQTISVSPVSQIHLSSQDEGLFMRREQYLCDTSCFEHVSISCVMISDKSYHYFLREAWMAACNCYLRIKTGVL